MEIWDLTGDVEGLGVRLAFNAVDSVARQCIAAGLKVLLQPGLGVLESLRGRQGRDPGLEEPVNDPLGGLQSPIEEHGTTDSLKGVRQDGLPAEAAGLELARAKLKLIAQPDGGCNLGQGFGAHHPRPQTAQVPLGGIRKRQVEVLGDDEVEDSIPEEFETLVIATGSATVSQRGNEQAGVTRLVFESSTNPS